MPSARGVASKAEGGAGGSTGTIVTRFERSEAWPPVATVRMAKVEAAAGAGISGRSRRTRRRSPATADSSSAPRTLSRSRAAAVNSRGSSGAGGSAASGAGRVSSRSSMASRPGSTWPATVVFGYSSSKTISLPCWCALRSVAAAGLRRSGGSGAAFLPQAGRRVASAASASTGARRASERIAAQILVLDDAGERLAHVGGVDGQLDPGHIRGLERHLVEQPLEDGLQPPRADVLGTRVHLRRQPGDLLDRLGREAQGDALGREERRVLLGQRVLGLGQDAHEVGLGEALELDPNGEAALQLGQQVRRLGGVERAG